MPEYNQLLSRQRVYLLIAVISLLASLYMLTFSARVDSTDALFLLDATGSLVEYGDDLLDISVGQRLLSPQSLPSGLVYPLPSVNAEWLQITLATPLYTLAKHVDGLGLAHTVYLFNVFVTALIGGVMFLYVLALGYDERTAVVGALLFGLTTIVWPYSKTFFQEPLTLLLILLAALLVERWRVSRYRSVPLLIAAIVCVIGAILSKGAATIALPGLLLIALPAFSVRLNRPQLLRRALLIVGVAVGLIVLLALLSEPLGISGRVGQFFEAFTRPQRYAWIALHGYLLSIGGSFWGTSPVLVLAVPGIWWLHRQRKYRYILVALVLILSFALVYALRQGPSWFGGLSWPPRFLLPVIAFPFFLTLPVIDRVVHQRASQLLLIAFGVITVYSLWWQFCGLSLWWGVYATSLPPESRYISEWPPGLNSIEYLRPFYIPPLWNIYPLDFVWVRTDMPLWVGMFGLFGLVCAYLVWRLLRGQVVQRIIVLLMPLVFLGLVGVGLRLIYDDDYYLAFDDDLWALLPIIEQETKPGDLLILSDLTYHRFFLNYYKSGAARILGLPDHPGEQPSPEQTPKVTSINPQELLDWKAPPLLHTLAETHNHVWLLTNSGPFIPWSVRVVERFMSQYYYPAREFATGSDSRLLEYGLTPSSAPYAFKNPEQTTDLVYDDHIYLGGFDLPAGTTFQPGQVVPLALYWWADEPLDTRYKVALLLRDANGVAVVDALNTEPGGGFAPTDGWLPNVPVWDHRGVALPDNLPAGEYQLWVVVYAQNLDGQINNLTVEGAQTQEGFIGVLPTRITVE